MKSAAERMRGMAVGQPGRDEWWTCFGTHKVIAQGRCWEAKALESEPL
jgi:hypothetical protein